MLGSIVAIGFSQAVSVIVILAWCVHVCACMCKHAQPSRHWFGYLLPLQLSRPVIPSPELLYGP